VECGKKSIKVGVVSLGCAKNLINTEQMMFLLREAGYSVSGDIDGADVVLVNTCGFIESAKVEAIDTIIELGQARLDGEIGKLLVAGCLVERYRDQLLAEMPEIDGIIGVGSFENIVNAVDKALCFDGRIELFGDINAPISETKRIITTSAKWAYIKIAEGCDNKCAFCVIPNIRGKFRSRPMENIVSEANELVRLGIKELILVAQDSTRYGLDLYGKRSLATLLKELCAIKELKWIRLHYLYPDDITDELIELIAENEKILKYLDMPIQHISDKVLRKMNRRGNSKKLYEIIKKLRFKIPGVVIRTSIITGLPGEGEKEFGELTEFLKNAKIERAGVFPYSPEEGTTAAEMKRPDTTTALKRAETVSDIQMHIMDRFNESRIGDIIEVLVESCDGGAYRVRSYAESPDVDGCITVFGEGITLHEFLKVRITDIIDGEPVGELL